MKTLARPSLWLALWLCCACADDPTLDVPGPTQQESSPSKTGDAEAVAECDQAEDGTSCGEPGRVMHCIFNACVHNVCGDGVAAGSEECDDGNERNGDGCNDLCGLEQCGNGRVDKGEECDDGNTSAGDGCSLRCRRERCGNGIIDPGESCDDGNARDDDLCDNQCQPQTGGAVALPDAGAGATDAGGMDAGQDAGSMDATAGNEAGPPDATASEASVDASDAAKPTEAGPPPDAGPTDLTDHRSAACKTCIEERCRNYKGSGFDLLSACTDHADPTTAQQCKDAYLCSLNATDKCADDAVRGPISCYCGLNRTIDQCSASSGDSFGPAGACIPQWEIATGCAAGDNVCVNERFVQQDRASYGAYYLIQCTTDPDECGTQCRP